MKLFDDLTPSEKDLALQLERDNMLMALASRTVHLEEQRAQQEVEKAIGLAVRRRTPQLAPHYIYSALKQLIDNLAAGSVKSNLYAEPHEVVIDNVVGCANELKYLQ